MRIENILLRSRYDGLDVSVLVIRPEAEPVAVLQLAHGMRGCKERFIPFMTFLAEHGIACVANDHRGHGMSVKDPSDRGYMYSGGHVALVDDMKMLTEWVHGPFAGIPVFLLGHSMGSLAVRMYLKNKDDAVSGVFVCGSPSYSRMVVPGLVLSRILSVFHEGRIKVRTLFEFISWIYNRRFAGEGPDAWTCSDIVSRMEFKANPSCSFDFSVNGMHAVLSLMREAYSRKGWSISHPDLPIYFISGSDDPCMRNEAAFHSSPQHMADIGYKNVTSALYDGMRHEVLNEVCKEMVWEDVLEHIKREMN